jgi:hypothetical protein
MLNQTHIPHSKTASVARVVRITMTTTPGYHGNHTKKRSNQTHIPHPKTASVARVVRIHGVIDLDTSS